MAVELLYNRRTSKSERASYNGSIEASQASDVGSIPIARSNIQKKLRKSLIFHFFQNINLVSILSGKCCSDLINGNFASVSCCHHSGRVPHLLTKDSWIYSSEFPPPVTTVTECVHTGSRKPKSF